MKKYRKHIIIGAVIVAVLAFVFWWGGNAPGLRGWNPQSDTVSTEQTGAPKAALEQTGSPAPSVEPSASSEPTGAPTGNPEKTPENKKPNEPATAQNRPEGTDDKPLTADEKVNLAAQMAGSS